MHIGISNGAAMEQTIGKVQSTEVWKKKGIPWHTKAGSVVCTHIYSGKSANQIVRLVLSPYFFDQLVEFY